MCLIKIDRNDRKCPLQPFLGPNRKSRCHVNARFIRPDAVRNQADKWVTQPERGMRAAGHIPTYRNSNTAKVVISPQLATQLLTEVYRMNTQ